MYIKAKTKKEKHHKILEMKNNWDLNSLSEEIPGIIKILLYIYFLNYNIIISANFLVFLTYCRSLKFNQEPDYSFLF